MATDASGKFEQDENGFWKPVANPAAGGGAPPAPAQSGGFAGAGASGQGFDQFGVQNGTGNIGTDSKGWDAAQAPGADGRDANGLPTYYQNVSLSQPGGPGAESINNPRFNQFLTQNSTNTLSDFLKSIGFDNTMTDTNYSGGGGMPSSPQHNLNINGTLMNAGLIQQRLNNNKNPDGSFNIEYFKKQMQDEINSNGYGGSQQSPQADGTSYGMGGAVPLTNNGVKYDYGMGAGAAVSPTDYAAASKAAGFPQTNGSAFNMYGKWGPGQNGSGGSPGGQQQSNPGSMSGMGMAGASGGYGGGSPGGYGGYGGAYGGGMPQRRPGFGGGGGMMNSQWYNQSEPNMRPGMGSNFQQQGQAPASYWNQQNYGGGSPYQNGGSIGSGSGQNSTSNWQNPYGNGNGFGFGSGAPSSSFSTNGAGQQFSPNYSPMARQGQWGPGAGSMSGMSMARRPQTQPYYGGANPGGSYNGYPAMY